MNNDGNITLGQAVAAQLGQKRADTMGSVFGGRFAKAERGAMLTDAEAALEEAQASGDEAAVAAIDQWIDHLLDDARAGRLTQPGDRPDVGTPPPASFDGGVRGGRRFNPPSTRGPQTSAELFAQAVATSYAERAAREGAGESVVVANV